MLSTSVQEDLDALAEKYDEAWQAARDSIGSQIGLFDEMATETELSISDMTTAMQSQVKYLNTYSENLRRAAEYDLDEGLIASLSDGSTRARGTSTPSSARSSGWAAPPRPVRRGRRRIRQQLQHPV